jgi:MoaA/NifB/PqqE/SkfB family radical SAM enzyme
VLKFARGALNTILLSAPLNVRLWLTTRCNFDCQMCGVKGLGLRDEMSLEQLAQVARNLRRIRVSQVILTGGEPLLRSDVVQVVRLFAGRGFVVRIQSNGAAHVTEDLLRRCYDAGLQDISVSLDTLDPRMQDAICGAGEVTANALRVLRFCARHYGHRGVVAANVVLSAKNFVELPRLARFLHQQGLFFDPCIHSGTFAGGRAGDRQPDDPFSLARRSSPATEEVMQRLLQMAAENYRILTTRRTLLDLRRYLRTGDCSWDCRAGELSFDVLPGGQLAPCCETVETALEEPVADLTREDFVAVFRSPAFRDKCRRRREACAGCLYGCYKDPLYLSRDPRVQLEALRKALAFGKLLH